MKKTILASLLLVSGSLSAFSAEEAESLASDIQETTATPAKEKELFTKPKFSGYIIGQYNANFKESDKSNSFSLRMIRLSVGGRILDDFEWKIQGQINGNTMTLGESPRIVDAFVEWQKLKTVRVKAGQFKRPFTFENPMNPIDQGFMGYAQNVMNLSGFTDRVGEHSSNGRDIGVQLQGDLFANAKGRAIAHYQIGVFNGQGINTKDVDNQKDVIGGAWIMPVKGMRIGGFGWIGSYARNGIWTEADGSQAEGTRKVNRYRYAISAEYKCKGWEFRSEYIHHTGGAFATRHQQSADLKKADFNEKIGDKADGVYALCIAPVIPQKLKFKARYDMYRPSASWTTAKTQYEVGLNYSICKQIELHAEYALVNDRSLAKHNYSIADMQMSVRF